MAKTYSVQELVDAGKRAQAGGDLEAAERFRLEALRVRDLGQSTPPLEEYALDGVEDFGHGVASGMRQASQFGQGWLWRGGNALGLVEDDTKDDMLTILNKRKAKQSEEMEGYKERSPYAFGGGEIVGETLFTAPIGGLGGLGAKTAISTGLKLTGRNALTQGTKTATALSLTGEGAIIGAYTSGGEDVLENAATGAAVDLIGGSVLNGVTKFAGSFARKQKNIGKANAAVNDTLADAAGRVTQAADAGGYSLNGVDASRSRAGFDALDSMSQDPAMQRRIDNSKANVEQQVTARAEEVVAKYGDISDLTSYQTAFRPVQVALGEIRQTDAQVYKNLYREFDELAAQTDTYIDTAPIKDALAELNFKSGNSAREGIVRKVNRDLDRYGIGQGNINPPHRAATVAPDGTIYNPSIDVSGNQLVRDNPASRAGSPEGVKPLSLENLEDLIQDLNEHWSVGMASGEKNYIREVKAMVTDYVDEALKEVGSRAGKGSEVYRIGTQAREARAAFSRNWETKDILARMTDADNGEFLIDHTKALDLISGKDGHRGITALRTKLFETDNGRRSFRSMQQAPLLEALQAATRSTTQVMEDGGTRFNHLAFEKVINKSLKTREARVALWGKEGAAEIQSTMDAWKLRSLRPETSGSQNTSGSATVLLKQGRFLSSGRMRNIARIVSGSAPLIGTELTYSRRSKALDAILDGHTIPESVRKDMIDDFINEWEDDFVGAGSQRLGNTLRQFLRAGAVTEATSDDNTSLPSR